MIEIEFKLLEELNLQRISYETFISKFPVEINKQYILENLAKAISERNSILFELLISLCYYSGFVSESCILFCRAMEEDWHKQHEEIARIFQFKLKCECSVESLMKAMIQKYDYLIVSGDYDSFVRKCMYSIANLRTDHSLESLKKLSKSTDVIIKSHALFQLERLDN